MAEDSTAKTSTPAPISILELVAALWRGKALVIAATLVCAVVAGAISFLLPSTYESNATLLLLPPPFKERGADSRVDKTDMVGLFPKLLTPSDYSQLLKSDDMMLKVVERMTAKGTYSDEDLARLGTPQTLGKALTMETRVSEKNAYRTDFSPVLVLKARAWSPELARDLAQTWGDLAVEESRSFYRKADRGLTGFFTEQYDKIASDLGQVFEKQQKVEAAWDETSARERLVEKAILLTRLEDDRVRALADLEAARKEVEELQARLAQEKPTVMLWKSPPTTALFLAEAAGTPPKAPEGGTDQRKGYYEETTNETYLYVQQQLADKQASLKGLEERERSLRESGEGTKKEMSALQEEAARYNYESKVLKRQADAFTRGYDLVADKVRQAQIAESEQEDLVDLKLVANAVQSDKKVAPKRSAIVFSAAALGFAIAAFAAVVRHRLEARLP